MKRIIKIVILFLATAFILAGIFFIGSIYLIGRIHEPLYNPSIENSSQETDIYIEKKTREKIVDQLINDGYIIEIDSGKHLKKFISYDLQLQPLDSVLLLPNRYITIKAKRKQPLINDLYPRFQIEILDFNQFNTGDISRIRSIINNGDLINEKIYDHLIILENTIIYQ